MRFLEMFWNARLPDFRIYYVGKVDTVATFDGLKLLDWLIVDDGHFK